MSGDTAEVQQIKTQNRQDAVEGMKIGAGPGAEKVPDASASQGGGLPLVASQAAYDRLPSGVQYRTADGCTGTKR